MKVALAFLFLLIFAIPASAQVSISINAPTYGFNVLPGSVRNINAIITGGTLNTVNWTVSATTGSATATLSASTGALPEVTVTIGSTAGTCSIGGSLGSYSVSSTATVTIEAQSVDDVTKTATTTMNVCANTTAVYVVPFYRALYVGQKADLQSYIVGNTNLAVTWSLGSCDGTAVGSLSDTSYRDTVFSGTGEGRCTVTATSNGDGTKSASATVFLTGNALPYSVTPNGTEPVDCTVDPDSTGTDYEVGPGKAYTTIQSVPMNTMAAGSTVRIWNTDTTGLSPTTYVEYFQVASVNGTATQPLRIVGCPDSLGNLPIVDGNGATGASWVSPFAAAGYGVASIWKGSTYGLIRQATQLLVTSSSKAWHLKNARPAYNFTPPSGGAAQAWVAGASCVNIRAGYQLVIVGDDMDNCSNGTFSDGNMNSGAWAENDLATLWEGSHIHSSGISGSFTYHQLYIQGFLQVAQFNRIDNYTSGADGSNLKSRGIGDIFRYNYIGSGAQRQMDMVEVQDGQRLFDF